MTGGGSGGPTNGPGGKVGVRLKLMTVLLLAGLASIVTPGLLLPNPGEAARSDSISALW